MGTKIELHLILGLFQQVERWLVGTETDENADFFSELKGWSQPTKAAQIKIADQAVECTRVPAEQNGKAIREAATLLVCDKC
jgi:hypothetical protein